MRTNKEIIRKNRLGRFVGPATLAFGLLVGSGAFGLESDIFSGQWNDLDNSLTLPGDAVGNGLVSLPQFDDNNGLHVLQSITLRSGNVFLEGAVTYTNNGSGTVNVNFVSIGYFTDGPLTITGPNGLSFNYGTNFQLQLQPDGSTELNQGDSVTFSQSETQMFFAPVSNTITDSNLFAPFIGAGTIDISATGIGSFTTNISGGELSQDNIALLGRGGVEIEYEYIVIPEPGTIALFAIALGSAGGMAFLRCRKRS